jgi:AcrR family transcriptional regulator
MPKKTPQASTPSIRTKDAEQTQNDILLAAAGLFSEKGYAQVGLREIAAKVGITAALIVRYFGSKEALFEQVLTRAMDLSELLAGSPKNFGRDMVVFINRHQDNTINPLSMQLLAIADPKARSIAHTILQEKVLTTLAHWLDRDAAHTRAALITTVLSGVWLYRDLLPLPELSNTLSPAVANWLATTLQGIIDQSL